MSFGQWETVVWFPAGGERGVSPLAIAANIQCCLAAIRAVLWGFQRRLIVTDGVLLLAVSPLLYVLPSKAAMFWIAPPEYFASGIANGGLKVAILTLLCDVTPAERNSLYFCVYTACIGVFGALGTFAGGLLVKFFQAMPALQIYGSGFRAFFIAGAALRALVVISGVWWARRTLANDGESLIE